MPNVQTFPAFQHNEKPAAKSDGPFNGGATRIRTGDKGFADLCLTTWRWHQIKWSGRRDSDSRPPPWQGGALPTELLPLIWCLGAESNHRHCDFQSHALPTELPRHLAMRKGLEPSTSSVTGWHSNQLNYRTIFGGNNRARTCDPLLVRQMLSQLSYAPKPFVVRLSRRRVL